MLHMSETGAYTQEMLDPFSERLANLKEILKQDSADGKHPEPIVRLMSRKLEGVGKCSPYVVGKDNTDTAGREAI